MSVLKSARASQEFALENKGCQMLTRGSATLGKVTFPLSGGGNWFSQRTVTCKRIFFFCFFFFLFLFLKTTFPSQCKIIVYRVLSESSVSTQRKMKSSSAAFSNSHVPCSPTKLRSLLSLLSPDDNCIRGLG